MAYYRSSVVPDVEVNAAIEVDTSMVERPLSQWVRHSFSQGVAEMIGVAAIAFVATLALTAPVTLGLAPGVGAILPGVAMAFVYVAMSAAFAGLSGAEFDPFLTTVGFVETELAKWRFFRWWNNQAGGYNEAETLFAILREAWNHAFTYGGQVLGALVGVAVARGIFVTPSPAVVVPPVGFDSTNVWWALFAFYFFLHVVFLRLQWWLRHSDHHPLVRAIPLGLLYGAGQLFVPIVGNTLNPWAALMIGAFYGSLHDHYLFWLTPTASMLVALLVELVFFEWGQHFKAAEE